MKTTTGITEDLRREVRRHEEKILDTTRKIRRVLERVDDHLDRGLRLNDLGELQGLGLDLDRTIALRQAMYDTISKLDSVPEIDLDGLAREIEDLDARIEIAHPDPRPELRARRAQLRDEYVRKAQAQTRAFDAGAQFGQPDEGLEGEETE